MEDEYNTDVPKKRTYSEQEIYVTLTGTGHSVVQPQTRDVLPNQIRVEGVSDGYPKGFRDALADPVQDERPNLSVHQERSARQERSRGFAPSGAPVGEQPLSDAYHMAPDQHHVPYNSDMSTDAARRLFESAQTSGALENTQPVNRLRRNTGYAFSSASKDLPIKPHPRVRSAQSEATAQQPFSGNSYFNTPSAQRPSTYGAGNGFNPSPVPNYAAPAAQMQKGEYDALTPYRSNDWQEEPSQSPEQAFPNNRHAGRGADRLRQSRRDTSNDTITPSAAPVSGQLSSRDETIALNSLASASRRKRAEKSNIRPARTMPPNRRRTLELKNNPYFNDDAPDLDYDDDDDRSGAPIRTFLVVLLTLLLTGTLVLLFFQNQKLNASTAGKAASEQLATLQQEITTLKLENEALQAQLSKRTDTQANGETPEEDTYLAPDDTTPEQTTTGQNNSNASSNANQTSTTNASGQTVHTVASGETLSKISQKYYGTPNQYYKIQEANKISDEDAGTIQAGMTLIIP